MARVLKVHSVDQTLPQEAIESALLLGDVARVRSGLLPLRRH